MKNSRLYNGLGDGEIAAFYKLNLITSDDIEPIATKWMLEDKGGVAVACLASQHHSSLREISNEFEEALQEIPLNIPDTREAVKMAFGYHLQQILNDPEFYLLHLNAIVHLDRDYSGKINLFDRPDCDQHFRENKIRHPNSTSSKYVGQEFGVESLIGLYYQKHDFISWTNELEIERKQNTIEEAQKVLNKFYNS